jgi:hypothetical protein
MSNKFRRRRLQSAKRQCSLKKLDHERRNLSKIFKFRVGRLYVILELLFVAKRPTLKLIVEPQLLQLAATRPASILLYRAMPEHILLAILYLGLKS